jgi:hypothetical protein
VDAVQLSLALRKVAETLRVGERAHPDGEWRSLTMQVHLHQAGDHLSKAMFGILGDIVEDEDNLAHAATRLLLVIGTSRKGTR